MSNRYMCKACGQPLPPKERAGVYLPPLKAAIFDYIRKYPGCTLGAIVRSCHLTPNTGVNVIRQHIHQINSQLAGSGWSISGNAVRGHYSVLRREAPNDGRKRRSTRSAQSVEDHE